MLRLAGSLKLGRVKAAAVFTQTNNSMQEERLLKLGTAYLVDALLKT